MPSTTTTVGFCSATLRSASCNSSEPAVVPQVLDCFELNESLVGTLDALRAANIDREVCPLIGFVPSLLLGAAATIGAVALGGAMPLLPEHAKTLLVPGAIASMFTGFILLIGRAKAISQVCGYLILENGIYLFGLLLIHSTPWLVESGILLDVTVGVFIIGIIVDRIQRAFDSLDTRKLTTLRE